MALTGFSVYTRLKHSLGAVTARFPYRFDLLWHPVLTVEESQDT